MKRTYKKKSPKRANLNSETIGLQIEHSQNPLMTLLPLELTTTTNAVFTSLPEDSRSFQINQSSDSTGEPPQKIFNVKHLSPEEQILLTNNGARFFQAQNQEEVSCIIQQALENKSNDTILIVGPNGRQVVNRDRHILTTNQYGDHLITQIVHSDTKEINMAEEGTSVEIGSDIDYPQPDHSLSNDNPEPVLQDSPAAEENRIQETTNENADVFMQNVLLGKSHRTVIYEKHLHEEIQILATHTNKIGKSGAIYDPQETEDQRILFDSNNNNSNREDSPDRIKPVNVAQHHVSIEEITNDKSELSNQIILDTEKSNANPHIQLIYGHNKAVIYTATSSASSSGENSQKELEIYETDQNDLQHLINNGHQVVLQESLQYSQQNETPAVFVVQDMLDNTGQNLRRRRSSSNPQSPMSLSSVDASNTEPNNQLTTSQSSGYVQTRYFEHPLTAATSAMLNISGTNNGATPTPEDESTANSGSAGINLNSLVPQHQVHLHNSNGGTTFLYEYYKLPEKDTTTIHWSSTHTTTKMNGQTTPLDVSGLSQNEIQGLLLGSHPSSATSPPMSSSSVSPPNTDNTLLSTISTGSSILSAGNLTIKREPEDLRKDKCSRSQKVLVVQSPSPSSLHIKEQPPSPGSPQTENMYTASAGTPQIYLQGSSHQASNLNSNTPSPGPYVTDQYGMYASTARIASSTGGSAFVSEPYYREYFSDGQNYVQSGRSIYSGNSDTDHVSNPAYEGRITGQTQPSESYHHHNNNNSSSANKNVPIYAKAVTAAGLTVDLPSPDSGIGTDAITPRDQNNTIHQSFDYTELCHSTPIMDGNAGTIPVSVTNIQRSVVHGGGEGSPTTSISHQVTRSRPWHDFGRQSEADKVQIPKIFANSGFRYNLESPISSSQRREDDRITYINKGQFYGITLEYIHDPEKPLKNQTVKSVIMLMFREEKSPEDEIKAWQFWHSRQHSVKQRILDADTKNSVGIVGCIEEIAHNAIAVYWNPLESSAKINIAVQCLSTDFSSQKGVKGLPLHIQIDTFEDPRDTQLFHRGYCQIKVFCDKGAERKTRDEERRAAKRKMTTTGRKKLDELYHPVTERSEFYTMQDVIKPPVLFSPSEDMEKLSGMDLQSFYGHDPETFTGAPSDIKPFLLNQTSKPATPTLKFHNHFPPDITEKKEHIMENTLASGSHNITDFSSTIKRQRMSSSPLCDRVMLYVRQENEEIYTPLHVVPPTTSGLLNAIENKYKISSSSINNLYRKNRKGIIAKIDDDMLSYYCNEDIFLLEVRQIEEDLFDISLTELMG